ncbi:hypothetical protein Poli38472_003947 [Pythium oligandrum]|uniref:Uncharacterized protein n=1 Tax=Pythium oligandrum TaxID=41045 RepID=A0A8K1FNS6_PYTOL|nr:hypothetical protein Poli38472_003947 [Pythium oligandrum]|eukprot:TMW66182.1 hypothetical protein Poli38472_003947 [Pythium oligandrum]
MTTADSHPSAVDVEAASDKPRRRKTDADYVPAHLRPYVFHSQEDFYVSRFFDPVLLAHLMYEGFLPIASEHRGQCFLLPKLHRKRCMMLLDAPEHVPKSVKKRGKKYKLVLNKDFDGVVKGCHAQHGIPWLYPPIVAGFKTLFEAGTQGIELFPGRRVRFYSVELVDVSTGELVAGELGYTVGKVYTSLTGFSGLSGAGTVQLHALSKVLYLSGFEVWDLGMSMPYKMSLGASDMDRDDFLRHLYRWRGRDCMLQLEKDEGDLLVGAHVKVIFDISRPKSVGRVPGIHSDNEDDYEHHDEWTSVDDDVEDATRNLSVDDDDEYDDNEDESGSAKDDNDST